MKAIFETFLKRFLDRDFLCHTVYSFFMMRVCFSMLREGSSLAGMLFCGIIAITLLKEIYDHYTPGHVADISDIMANMLGFTVASFQ